MSSLNQSRAVYERVGAPEDRLELGAGDIGADELSFEGMCSVAGGARTEICHARLASKDKDYT